jgi:GxxExxY protein
MVFDEAFRADLIVEEKVIVELKSVERVKPVHKKQLLTYLRLADKRLGLLLNFGTALLKEGITRVVNDL